MGAAVKVGTHKSQKWLPMGGGVEGGQRKLRVGVGLLN